MTSGTRTLVGEVLSWGIVALLLAWVLANFEDVKAVTAEVLGMDTPQSADQPAKRKSTRKTAKRKKTIQPLGHVELSANNYGHYEARLEVNGRGIDAMVDTGATLVALSHKDARRAGIIVSAKDYTHRVRTANGIARVAPVTLTRVRLGDITVRNVRGIVSEPGAMNGTLLGMSFLSRLSRFEIRNGRLILQE